MNKLILEKLSQITEEERLILNGGEVDVLAEIAKMTGGKGAKAIICEALGFSNSFSFSKEEIIAEIEKLF
jgi:hypothetical protein